MLGDPQPSRLMLEKPEVIKQNMKLEPQESLDAYRPPTGTQPGSGRSAVRSRKSLVPVIVLTSGAGFMASTPFSVRELKNIRIAAICCFTVGAEPGCCSM